MKLLKKRWCMMMVGVGILFPTIVYGNDCNLNSETMDNSKLVAVEEIDNAGFSKEVNSIQRITPDKLKNLSQDAEIEITEYNDDRVEYSFFPKKPSKIEIYENGEELKEYEMVKLTAVLNNQNTDIDLNSKKKASYSFSEGDDVQTTITKKHPDVRLRGVYNYTEGVAKEPGAKVNVARLNWISGCVVKRTERFGKNLKLYADASGDRVNTKGKTIKPGKEKTSVKTIASPKINKAYRLTTNFKYFYSLSTVGNIHGSVTYQVSHNGKSYYKVSNIFNKGNFRA